MTENQITNWNESRYIRKDEDCIMLSIDESLSSTGIAVFVNGKLTHYGKVVPDAEDKKESVARKLMEIFHIYKPDILVLEDVYQGKCINGFKGNVFLQGVCFGYALLNHCDYFTYYPTQWRKLLGITAEGRKGLKEKDKQFVYEKYGIVTDDDSADAICIGCAHIQYVDELID